jgi:hypothetical protein
MPININMDKAKELWMDAIRGVRNSELEKLDVETMKGVDVQTQKQTLRDIPQIFDLSSATNPGELKLLWPSTLPTGE